MRRALLAFVLLVATSVAVEPLIHTHPLTQTSSQNSCAVCVNAVARMTSLAPVASALQAVVAILTIAATPGAIHGAATPLAPRAPPAA